MKPITPAIPAIASVERITALETRDLNDLCDAADAAILDGNGFGWLRPPPRPQLEAYWRGVLVVPERELFVGRLDGVIAAAAQLVKPPPNHEARAFAATLSIHFVAPWAREHGLARSLVDTVEAAAVAESFEVMYLDVRETQAAAIRLYESCGYERWGTLPCYARDDDAMIAGHFYVKRL
ncbi:MAG: GNAT family N-acetyltransferase [Alphaproteobacteria bacterium]